MYTQDLPVLVVLEIHNALCVITGWHEARLGTQIESLPDADGHLKESVSWEIAKKVKHRLN